MFLTVLAISFTYLLLAAHFLRMGHPILTLLCILLPFLLVIKKRLSLIILEFFTYMGAGIWVHTIIMLIKKRIKMGTSYRTALIILASVALFTLFSGLILNKKKVLEKYSNR